MLLGFIIVSDFRSCVWLLLLQIQYFSIKSDSIIVNWCSDSPLGLFLVFIKLLMAIPYGVSFCLQQMLQIHTHTPPHTKRFKGFNKEHIIVQVA